MRAIMLTSSNNQYLRPEYLTPLPTTLDAKKSPLALLAQTCSQIGADPPSSSAKSTLLNASSSVGAHHSEIITSSLSSSSSGKSKGSSSGTSNCSSSNNNSNKSHDHHHQSEKSRKSSSVSPLIVSSNQSMNVNGVSTTNRSSISEDKSRSKTPGSKTTTPSPGNASPSSSNGNSTSTALVSGANPTNKSPSTTTTTTTSTTPVTSSTPADSTLSSSTILSSSSSSAKSTATAPQVIPLSESQKLRLNSTSPLNFGNSATDLQMALKHGLGFPGLYPPVVPSASSSMGTGIPPYLHSYARLKAAANAAAAMASTVTATTSSSSSDTLMSPLTGSGNGHSASSTCRDPFCTGCHLGQHHSHGHGLKAPCPAGCVQCDHHKNSPSLFGGFSFLPGFPPGFPGYPYSAAATAAAASGPYVCNWIIGESYCGKRFSSSEDLLQHLRIHTTSMCFSGGSGERSAASAVQNLALAAAAAGYPPPTPAHLQHSFSPAHTHGGHPHSHSHSLLSRTYPTPPLSPLSSARFHPYSKPGGGNGSLHSAAAAAAAAGLSPFGSPLGVGLNLPPAGFPSGFSGLGHPALSPYYPYSLYGQRLGASHP